MTIQYHEIAEQDNTLRGKKHYYIAVASDYYLRRTPLTASYSHLPLRGFWQQPPSHAPPLSRRLWTWRSTAAPTTTASPIIADRSQRVSTG
ncbi:hypothetical protein MCP1_390018 [Candidatus Terasakiella magnetica]|nr:hypothetical protein MCP1_390018 [Candidatus Terasakiella magnetica]